MNKHQLRTKRKEKDILLATVELVGNKPLNSITINDIKQKARVSQMTIYKLFENKNNLIHEAIIKITSDAVTEINEILNSDLPSTEKFKGYISTAFFVATKYPQQKNLRDYINSSYDTDFVNRVDEEYKLTYPPLIKLYNELKDEGYLRVEIDFNIFIDILDMITKVDPIFHRDENRLNILLDGFTNFLK